MRHLLLKKWINCNTGLVWSRTFQHSQKSVSKFKQYKICGRISFAHWKNSSKSKKSTAIVLLIDVQYIILVNIFRTSATTHSKIILYNATKSLSAKGILCSCCSSYWHIIIFKDSMNWNGQCARARIIRHTFPQICIYTHTHADSCARAAFSNLNEMLHKE